MPDTEFKKQIDKWFASVDGRACMKGTAEGEFLANRLWLAFTAGYNTANKRLREFQEKNPGLMSEPEP